MLKAIILALSLQPAALTEGQIECEILRHAVESLLEMPPKRRAHLLEGMKTDIKVYSFWIRAYNWIVTHPDGELPDCAIPPEYQPGEGEYGA